MQIAKDIAVFPDNEPFVFQLILQLEAKRIVHSEQQVEQDNPREIRFLCTMINNNNNNNIYLKSNIQSI